LNFANFKQMKFPRLLHKLYFTPLLIDVRQRLAIEAALQAHLRARGAGIDDAQLAKMDPEYAARRAKRVYELVTNDTAVIHVDGIIDKNLSALDMLCYGGYDLNDFDRAVQMAQQNSDIRNVVLKIDSPGGSVTGVPESAALVAKLAQTKNVYAYSEGLMCSAAYYIASQADQMFSTSSSSVGSIGVYLALLDESKRLEMDGLKVDLIKAGRLKAAGSGFQPLTDEERAHFQGQVDKIYEMFTNAVSSKRPQVESEAMQGQSFFGEEALNMQLVDGIVSSIADVFRRF
jgi:signal peptide peptidase SppA